MVFKAKIKFEIGILAVISLVLISMVGVLLILENQHQASKELTQESIYKLKLKSDSLAENDELRQYVDSLSKEIVNIRRNSESYVDGLFDDIYRPLLYLLLSLSILQALVIISLLKKGGGGSRNQGVRMRLPQNNGVNN